MSDAPVITPLTPLGAFVTRVGRHPGQAALATYLARLREQARRGRCSMGNMGVAVCAGQLAVQKQSPTRHPAAWRV